MTATHGLSDGTVARIAEVLTRFPQVERALLFGSRAKATHRPGSDIDLALVGSQLDLQTLGRIDDGLDDLLLPYRFSLLIYGEATGSEIAAHIRRVGVPFFDKQEA